MSEELANDTTRHQNWLPAHRRLLEGKTILATTKRIIERAPKMHERSITLKGVPLNVWFWYYAPYEATQDDPGCSAEIEINNIFLDDYDVINLFGRKSLEEVETELWKLLEEGEDV